MCEGLFMYILYTYTCTYRKINKSRQIDPFISKGTIIKYVLCSTVATIIIAMTYPSKQMTPLLLTQPLDAQKESLRPRKCEIEVIWRKVGCTAADIWDSPRLDQGNNWWSQEVIFLRQNGRIWSRDLDLYHRQCATSRKGPFQGIHSKNNSRKTFMSESFHSKIVLFTPWFTAEQPSIQPTSDADLKRSNKMANYISKTTKSSELERSVSTLLLKSQTSTAKITDQCLTSCGKRGQGCPCPLLFLN